VTTSIGTGGVVHEVLTTQAQIRTVGIVGGGMMGAGIAEVCGGAGLEVSVTLSRLSSVEAARKRIQASLDHRLRKGTLSGSDRDSVLSRIRFTVNLADLSDCDCVIEAVSEHEETKLAIFAALDKMVEQPDALLASTTSSIPIVRLARATTRPHRVIGLHFFSPVAAMNLVEVVTCLLTDHRTRATAEHLVVEVLGKETIDAPDRAGFVVNTLLAPFVLSAVRMLESGFATADAIDRGMVLGCGHPVGPLRLADLVGLDLLLSVAKVLYEEHKEPVYAPPSLLLRLVEAGHLGRKTGKGFYEYG
jgi:3-hydroxybutyryl-CoA dehydrogenase